MDPVDPMEPLGIAEVAAMLGILPASLTKSRYRGADLPRPRWSVNNGKTPLWARRDVLAWLIAEGRAAAS